MEFKGTKKFPKYYGGDNYSIDLIFDNDAVISIDRRSRYNDDLVMSREEMEANALLISKALCFYEDAKNDLDLFDELLKSLPLGLQHLKNAIKERKKEKEQLIKQATEL